MTFTLFAIDANNSKIALATDTAEALMSRITDNWENYFAEEDGANIDVLAFTGSRSQQFAIEPAAL